MKMFCGNTSIYKTKGEKKWMYVRRNRRGRIFQVEKLGAILFHQLNHNLFIDDIFNIRQKIDQGIRMVGGQYTEDVDFANEPAVSSPEIPCSSQKTTKSWSCVHIAGGHIGTYI